MAHADPKHLGSLETKGSDEVGEMFCEHCEKHDNDYKSAEGYCVDCLQYMCHPCLKYHKRHAKGHTLKDRDSMPQDFCLEKCSTHAKELVKFYCGDCEEIACSECKENAHKNCMNVSHLPTLLEGIENSEACNDLIKDMDKLSEDIEQTAKEVKHNIQKISEQETMAIATIETEKEKLLAAYQKNKKEIIDKFDQKMEETIARLKEERQLLVSDVAEKEMRFEKKLNDNEKDVKEKIANTKNTDQKEHESINAENATLKGDLTALSNELVQRKNIGQRYQLFITMKKANKMVDKMGEKVRNLKEQKDIHFYTTESNVSTLDVNSIQKADTYFNYKELPSSRRKRKAIHHLDLPTTRAHIQCLCLMNESTLLVSNRYVNIILVYSNLKGGTIEYETIEMPDDLFSVTKVKDNKAAVTFLDEGLVRLITFSESMTVIKTDNITVGAGCRGIAYLNNHLIVSYDTRPAKVQILDMSGNVLKCVDKDSNGMDLFDNPWNLAVSPDNTTIYVSDWGRDTVTSMTLDGKVKAIYKDDQLSLPWQLTADESGAVYVCGWISENVYQLSSDLTKVKVLLDESHGMNRPISVAYCQNNKRLYVGMFNSNTIKVFNLSLE